LRRFRALIESRMRRILVLGLLMAPLAPVPTPAQPPGPTPIQPPPAASGPADPSGSCNVVTQPAEVGDNGELIPVPPTPEECAIASEIIEKFLGSKSGDFRHVRSITGMPGTVRVYVGRVSRFGQSFDPRDQRAAIWVSDRMIVIVESTSDFAGPGVRVIISDLETLESCEFPRWPNASPPNSQTIRELQRELDAGRFGSRELPLCHLNPVVID
jgi:hypothetical protein